MRPGRTSAKPPKGHTSYTARRTPPRSSGPPRYSNGSVKPHLLSAALDAASRRGYQAVRITDITDPANVTRQAFYSHFRDKRHCLCEALDSRLAAIERVAAAAIEAGSGPEGETSSAARSGWPEAPSSSASISPEWPGEIIDTIDELLAEHFGSTEGTKGRLIEALAAELERTEGLAGVRIGSLIKGARVPQGDFYRHFSGKRACFAALYEQRLHALVQDARPATNTHGSLPRSRPPGTEPLMALGVALASDRPRARLLLLNEGELPDPGDPTTTGSCRGALADAIADLLGVARDLSGRLLVGSVIEVSRSAVLTGDLRRLGSSLSALAAQLSDRPSFSGGDRPLKAVA